MRIRYGFSDLWQFVRLNKCVFGEWYSWGVFEIKFFKKGTAHLKFQNNKDWEALNRAYAEIKGEVLPEPSSNTKNTNKQDNSLKKVEYSQV